MTMERWRGWVEIMMRNEISDSVQSLVQTPNDDQDDIISAGDQELRKSAPVLETTSSRKRRVKANVQYFEPP